MKALISLLKSLVIVTLLSGVAVFFYGLLMADNHRLTLILIGLGLLVVMGILLVVLYFVGKRHDKNEEHLEAVNNEKDNNEEENIPLE